MNGSFRKNNGMGRVDCFPDPECMSLPAATFGLKSARFLFMLSMLIAGMGGAAYAQYQGHINKNADTGPTLRATGIFEWTGDLNKPKAGRLIPLAVWDGQQYQPGGLYLAAPAPLTVLTGTIYELELAGTPKGLFNVNGAENLGGSWIAVGSVKPEVVIKAKARPPMSKHPPQVVKDVDSDKPTLHRKDDSSDSGTTSTSSASTADSDRPTLHRKDGSDSGSGSGSTTSGGTTAGSTSSSSGSSTSASDPDKPTLHRRDASDSSSGSASGSDSSGTSTASTDDSDRPTLHRKDSGDNTQDAPAVDPDRPILHERKDTTANAGGPVSFPADPDRPKLRYGRPQVLEGSVEPSKLEGLPMDMNQMAAISDVKTTESHPFTYSWADPADAAKMKAAMEVQAQKAIAAGFTADIPQPKNVTKTATKTATRHKAPPPPPLPTLEDEKFNAFELSYNGGATLVMTAKSTGADGEAKYVTLVAQPDFYGVPHILFKQLTSDKALDVVPRMRLVDVADTDGDGRAELIFELRGKTGRSFGIYRLSSGRVLEAFNTGPLP